MAKEPTAKTGFPRKPEDCFDSRHLSASDFKVFNAIKACAVAAKTRRAGRSDTGPLIFNAPVQPWLCNAVPCSKNHAHDIVKRLHAAGWLILLEKGKKRSDGTSAPDEWQVVVHDDFVKAHPDSCPPDEYAPDFETARDYGVRYGKKLRKTESVPVNFLKLIKIIEDDGSGIGHLTMPIEQAVKIFQDWERRRTSPTSVDQVQVPQMREPTGPTNVDPDRSQNCVQAGPAVVDAPVPQLWTAQSQNCGHNLSTASVKASEKATTTTTSEEEATAKTAVTNERLREWLSLLWSQSALHVNEGENLRHALHLLPTHLAAVQQLIQEHSKTIVRLAFASFALDESAEVNKETRYPVTVFLRQFESYMDNARRDYGRYKDFNDTSKAILLMAECNTILKERYEE